MVPQTHTRPAAAGSGNRGSATSEGRGLPLLSYSAQLCSGRRGQTHFLNPAAAWRAERAGGAEAGPCQRVGRPRLADRDTVPWMACLGFPSCKVSVTKLTALVPR